MGGSVSLDRAEVTTLAVDGIVNPTNSLCIMNTGLSGAIRRSCRPPIEQQAQLKAPLAVGAAIVTKGGNLPAKHIIHAPIIAEPPLPDDPGLDPEPDEDEKAAKSSIRGWFGRSA